MNHSTSRSPPVTWLLPGEILNIYKLVKICVTSQLDVAVVWPISCWISTDQSGPENQWYKMSYI